MTALTPILIAFTLTSSTWDHAVSTKINANQIILLPKNMATNEYLHSFEFHNRALMLLAEKQYSTDNSDCSYTMPIENQETKVVCLFNELQGDFALENTVSPECNLINNGKACYYDEHYDDQNMVQITVGIEIFQIKEISEDQLDFLKSLNTPIDELNMTTAYALEKENEDRHDDTLIYSLSA